MQSHSVFLLAFFTSIFSATGTVFVVQKMHLIPAEAPAPAPQATVPKLEGLSENDARLSLASQGLILIVEGYKPHPTASEGTVIEQSSAVGQPVPKGSVITVTLAEAKPKVPNVVGQTVEQASHTLQGLGLKLELGENKPDDSVPTGQILAQKPPVDTQLSKGESVTVDVSAGSEMIEVPNLVGLSIGAIKQRMEALGLDLKTKWVRMAEVETYIALSQNPKAGTKLKKGDEITVTANGD